MERSVAALSQASAPSRALELRDAARHGRNCFTLLGMQENRPQQFRAPRRLKVSSGVAPNGKPGGGRSEQVPGSGTRGNQSQGWRDASSLRSWSPNLKNLPNFPIDRIEPQEPDKSFGPQGSRAKERAGKGKEGEDPYRVFEGGAKAYLDELDVLDLLDPPRFLRPFNSSTFNHAAFLWKKIGDIPEERRHRLVTFLQPKHIDMMWKLVGSRYEYDEVFVDDPLSMLPSTDLVGHGKPVYWDGKVNGVPWAVGWLSKFQKVFFVGDDGGLYGRVIAGGPLLKGLARRFSPLYFKVERSNVVAFNGERCDLAFYYDSGHLHLQGRVPEGFPAPAKHVGPFANNYVDYLRAVGPGVFVGQAGQMGSDPPQADLGKFVLIKRCDGEVERPQNSESS